MRRIIVALLLVVPCLCFGQAKHFSDIEIEGGKKTLSIRYILDSLPALCVPDESPGRNRGIVDMPTIKNISPPLFIVDGIEMPLDSIMKLDPDNIESVSKVDDDSFFCHNNNIILITTKGNKPVGIDDLYEVRVLDTGYEGFLLTQKSKAFYTVSSLKLKNIFMVNEWNCRYRQPMIYNPDIYEVSIDYDANRYYGLEFEYRLYMFFKFMEKQYGISLLNNKMPTEV
jgi:hypothetical protein